MYINAEAVEKANTMDDVVDLLLTLFLAVDQWSPVHGEERNSQAKSLQALQLWLDFKPLFVAISLHLRGVMAIIGPVHLLQGTHVDPRFHLSGDHAPVQPFRTIPIIEELIEVRPIPCYKRKKDKLTWWPSRS